MQEHQSDELARTIRAALHERRISQADAGAAIGLSQPAMSRRLAGEVPWRDRELRALAHLLGITLAQLLEPPQLLVDDDEVPSDESGER